MKQKRTNDLGNDQIFLLVIKLAIPTMIAQLVNVLYSIIDRMYIGHIPVIGDLALAGVGVCGPIVTLLSSFGTLIGLGGSILMAMRMGEGEHKKAEQILSNSFMLLLAFSAVLTVLFLLIKDNLLIWFGASEVTFQYANTYMTIYTIGTFFALLAIGLNSFITCQGFATTGMMTVIVGALTNIVLDSVFIFGFNIGVAGAAWATVVAQMCSCLFAVLFLFSKCVPIGITFGGYDWNIVKKIITIGISPFIITGTDSVIIIAMNAVLQKYGGATQGDLLISCATIVQSYMLLISSPLIGITSGTQAIISYNYGARKTDRVRMAEKYILSMAVTFTVIMMIVSQLLPQYFVLLFTNSQETMQLSIWGIKVFTLAIIPMSIQYSFVDGMTALGRIKTALVLSLFRKTTYVIATFMIPRFFLAKYTFFAQPIADILGATLSAIVFLLVFNPYLKKRELED